MLLFAILLPLLCPPDTSNITVLENVVYGRAMGYWSDSSLKENDWAAQFFQLTKTAKTRELELTMDIYLPDGYTEMGPRPLVMLMHGGAFFANSKTSMPVSGRCRALAEEGFIATSVNYRMGFTLSRKSVSKAGADALEDASNALEYLLNKSDSLNIDRSKVFIGGASSGAITALRLAASEDCPPIIGIIDMWGGINDLSKLDNCDAAILAFHGDEDTAVPYDEGYPLGGKSLMDYLYGSKALVEYRKTQGKDARHTTFHGYAHAPYRNKKYEIIDENYNKIVEQSIAFIRELCAISH